MMVRPRKSASARRAVTPPGQPAQYYAFPPPVNGWVTSGNLAAPPEATARLLDNWIVRAEGIEMRKGTAKHAKLGAAAKSIFQYRSGSTSLIFAATEAAIFDVTAPATAETTLTPAVSSLTSGAWVAEQFGNTGGQYLLIANGADAPQIYDGTSWAAATLTGSGLTASDISYVWSFGSRLFFLEAGTMNVWYLAADAISGTLSKLVVGGVFSRGGSLLWGARMSMDAGDGIGDKFLVGTTEGEVAVYAGTDPSSANDWSLEGVFALPKTLGKKGVMRVGGDVVIATEAGLIPMSRTISTDASRLDEIAYSDAISEYWQAQVQTFGGVWEIMKLDQEEIIVVSQPDGLSLLVMNAKTGAWSRFTGLDETCLCAVDGEGFFGGADGYVRKLQTTGADDGIPYTSRFVGQYDPMGAIGQQKTLIQARSTFDRSTPANPKVGFLADFVDADIPPPNSAAEFATSLWDSAIWDTALWDGALGGQSGSGRWASIGRTGTFLAPVVLVTSGTVSAPEVTMAAIDAQYRIGAIVQ